jgi:hypothetical protein
MGNCLSQNNAPGQPRKRVKVKAPKIGNNFETREALVRALRKAGLESSNLLVAFDFTKSNTWQGEKTFENQCLHHLGNYKPPPYTPGLQAVDEEGEPGTNSTAFAPPPGGLDTSYQPTAASYQHAVPQYGQAPEKKLQRSTTITDYKQLNPYQSSLLRVGKTLDPFDDDHWIPSVIFGHARERGAPYIKSISEDKRGSYGMDGVLADYERAVGANGFAGPTTFAPVIDWACDHAKNGEYHILVIIGDGAIGDGSKETRSKYIEENIAAIQRARNFPLSIIFIGVGDGDSPDEKDNWQLMRSFDDEVPGQEDDVDNWQSVYATELDQMAEKAICPEAEWALWCLMEIPEQYLYFKRNGMIKVNY